MADIERVAVFIIQLGVSFYRSFLSGIFGGNCRFHPTCSEYAQECLASLPLARSASLIFQRLVRCHPFGPSGYDPVPQGFPQQVRAANERK